MVEHAGAGYIATVRRILAILSLFAMGNLAIAQAAWSCDRDMATSQASASLFDEHAHHGTTAPGQVPDAPAGEGQDHCLTMPHCVIAPALAASTAALRQHVAVAGVPVTSELAPLSARAAPELPPPRA